MKERPILFSAPMVRAILDGRKTQTRRIVKNIGVAPGIGEVLKGSDDTAEWPDYCPHGKVGDRLWVRETWQGPILDDDEFEEYRRDGKERFINPHYCVYRATDQLDAIDVDDNELKWRPSIHMPRWASRILLEITNIRVERLNDISEEDAIAEGIKNYENGCYGLDDPGSCMGVKPSIAYMRLWNHINGQGSWDLNPWVWCLTFRIIK